MNGDLLDGQCPRCGDRLTGHERRLRAEPVPDADLVVGGSKSTSPAPRNATAAIKSIRLIILTSLKAVKMNCRHLRIWRPEMQRWWQRGVGMVSTPCALPPARCHISCHRIVASIARKTVQSLSTFIRFGATSRIAIRLGACGSGVTAAASVSLSAAPAGPGLVRISVKGRVAIPGVL